MTKLKLVLANYLDRLAEFGIYQNSSGKDVWFHIALKVKDTPCNIFKRVI